VAHNLGARILVLTNAAGGIRHDLPPGSLMIIRDHIEWTMPESWRRLAAQQRDRSPYSPRLMQLLRDAAGKQQVFEGVYASVLGPCYETPAEIRALRACGADAVGMSTAREARVAYELGMECAAISCITNRAAGLGVGPICHEEVLTSVAAQAERLEKLLDSFIECM
jgi:purine-nucleoside phosphorylase